MSRPLVAAFSASILIHAGAGVALVRWNRPLGREPVVPPATEIQQWVLQTGPDDRPVAGMGDQPTELNSPPAAVAGSVVERTKPIAVPPTESPAAPLPPAAPLSLTPAANVILEPLGSAPETIDLVASRLPTITGQSPSRASPQAEDVGGYTSMDGSKSLTSDAAANQRAGYRRNPPPEYPAEAALRRWEGTVLLRVGVNPRGEVDSLVVAASSGHPILDEAAARAVRGWEFEPPRINSTAIAVTVEVPIRFYLREKNERP